MKKFDVIIKIVIEAEAESEESINLQEVITEAANTLTDSPYNWFIQEIEEQ